MTASPPTSSPLIGLDGTPWVEPPEWTPGYVRLGRPPATIDQFTVTLNGSPLPVLTRRIGDDIAVVAEWPRSGPGWFTLIVETSDTTNTTLIRVPPRRIDETAFITMLEDLEGRLPVSVALELAASGARIGVTIDPGHAQTLATEVARLRRAVRGQPGRPGLVAVLSSLADSPHQVLATVGEWVRRQRARRIDPTRLAQSLWRAGNIDDGLPSVLIDQRVNHTLDLYENRILRSFHDVVRRRLQRVRGVLASRAVHGSLLDEVEEMLTDLRAARRRAGFLDDVRPLRHPPTRITMVLLRRPEYRAAYEGYLDFRRRLAAHLDDPRTTEPLTNLPRLYQLWCALVVIETILRSTRDLDFRTYRQELVRPIHGSLVLEPLPPNRPALSLRRPDGWELTVTHERYYPTNATASLRSVSFPQVPDLALELTGPNGETSVVVFDPKYKLISEDTGEGPADGTPVKADVDKMHAYRDAIRTREGDHVVSLAATLYPGWTRWYGDGLAALHAVPGEDHELTGPVTSIVAGWLHAAGVPTRGKGPQLG